MMIGRTDLSGRTSDHYGYHGIDRHFEPPPWIGEILSELAYDLDYYEPNDERRREDPSFYGDDRLERE